MTNTKRLLSISSVLFVSMLALLLSFTPQGFAEELETSAAPAQWNRLAGGNRYETMARINSEGFSTCDTVILATGTGFADALAATPLAGAYDCPIVLNQGNYLNAQARAEIIRLEPLEVVVIGGTSAIPQTVVREIESLDIDVTRISGANRIETALEIYYEGIDYWQDTAIIASGYSYPDALSVSPFAWTECAPILLVEDKKLLDSEAVEALWDNGYIETIVFVGGTERVSNSIMGQLGDYYYERLAGADRYQTSVMVAEWSVANSASINFDGILVATGRDFPDALCGAALAGSRGTVLLLVDDTFSGYYGLNEIIDYQNFLDGKRGPITRGTALGGEGVIGYGFLQTISNRSNNIR